MIRDVEARAFENQSAAGRDQPFDRIVPAFGALLQRVLGDRLKGLEAVIVSIQLQRFPGQRDERTTIFGIAPESWQRICCYNFRRALSFKLIPA